MKLPAIFLTILILGLSSAGSYIWYLKIKLKEMSIEKEQRSLAVARQNLAIQANKINRAEFSQVLKQHENTSRLIYPSISSKLNDMKTPAEIAKPGYCERTLDLYLDSFKRNEL